MRYQTFDDGIEDPSLLCRNSPLPSHHQPKIIMILLPVLTYLPDVDHRVCYNHINCLRQRLLVIHSCFSTKSCILRLWIEHTGYIDPLRTSCMALASYSRSKDAAGSKMSISSSFCFTYRSVVAFKSLQPPRDWRRVTLDCSFLPEEQVDTLFVDPATLQVPALISVHILQRC